MLTEKVVFCIVMVPTLWITYGIYMVFFTNLDGPATALILMTMPVFSYIGIVVADAGMVDWKDLRPYLMRMLPTTRQRLASLPETRKTLQDDLRAFIRLIGPSLGELYYGKEVDWASIHETYLKSKEEETKKSVESKKSK
jgi:glycerol-3-phosphate O-acyltransferase/dihydroxyacetone phosphate acyltransferase